MWPFTGPSSVVAWQQAYRSGGSQPWHLSAADTALAFTRGFLGYREVDRVTSKAVTGSSALVGVGWRNPNGRPTTVGTVHLLKYGTAADAPWEVVGTRDTRLTLTSPRYGSSVTSPMRVGGRITGVDENLRVAVRSATSSTPLATPAPIPAGGDNRPWSTKVSFTAKRGTVLTVAVSTGGHVKGVEAFAVTAVRVDRSSATFHPTWGSGEKAGGSLSAAPLTNVRAGQHRWYDRLVFDVAGESSGYRVRYVDTVRTAGGGTAVPVAGGARLQVTVLSPTHDPERLITYYQPDDPRHVVPVAGYRTFRQVVWAGSFEGHTEFGLGVRARLPFRAFLTHGQNGRTMVVIDVAHAW